MDMSIYSRNGKLHFPTIAVTEAGFSLEIEPVETVESSDGEEIRRVIRRFSSMVVPKIPTPTEIPDPVVLKHVGARSWSEFARQCELWSIESDGEGYLLIPHRRDGDGWDEDHAGAERFSGPTALDDLAKRVLQVVQ